MRIIDPHIHMYSRTTDDYERMATAGIEAIIEPAFWLGNLRSSVGSFRDYFEHIITFERKRAQEYGIEHYTCICMNAKEANIRPMADQVVDIVEEYLGREGVVAVGEIGFDQITPDEEAVFRRQLLMGKRLGIPIVVHTPHVQKKEGVIRTVEIMKEEGVDPAKVLIDHNTEETIEISRASGAWCGMTVYPRTKLTPDRVVGMIKQHGTDRMIVNSSADWGYSDPLSVPKTAVVMRKEGFSRDAVEKVVFQNPFAFFKQSPNFTFKG
ncbi:MAG: TatD family hydrolase [Chitinivibrionia bacterium]|nr:TatD family hydrolase [Chitinivibrionia bacterium]